MRAEMAHVLQDAGPKIARQMQGRAPRKTGALQAGIKWKVLPRTLKLQVGLLGTKRGRAKLFYGWILNYGRKAQTSKASRRSPGGAISNYLVRVRAYPAQHFVTGAMPDLRKALNQRLKGIWNRVLRKASAGAGGGNE
jgi:hypothetical protein